MYENCQALPTKTPERRQDNVLVVLLPTPNALHTQLQYSILPLRTEKYWKVYIVESVSDISKIHREETIAFHEERGYNFLISNSGKPS